MKGPIQAEEAALSSPAAQPTGEAMDHLLPAESERASKGHDLVGIVNMGYEGTKRIAASCNI